jgi:predicted transcriptional regulator
MKKIGFADEILKLRTEGYSYKKIRDILKCSKGTISKYSSNDETAKRCKPAFKTQDEINILNEYVNTHTYKEASEYFKVSIASIKKYSNVKKYSKCKQTREQFLEHCKSYKRKLRAETKKLCVEYLGGVCKICGYNRCHKALDFHHLDATQKDFAISQNNTIYNFLKLKPELDKCILLCKNCHAEVHDGLIIL